MVEFPLEYIAWLDSRNIGRGWVVLDDALQKVEPLNCHSVGWIVKETDLSISVIPHIADEPLQGNGGIEIPKAAITARVTLRVKPDLQIEVKNGCPACGAIPYDCCPCGSDPNVGSLPEKEYTPF